MNTLFKRLPAALALFVMFVVLTILIDAGAQHVGRGSRIAIVGFILGFWVQYSRKVMAWIFDWSRRA